MQAHQLFIANLCAALLGLLLLGLVLHRRDRLSRAFFTHCATALIVNRLIVGWPAVFYTRIFWSFKETFYDAITAAVLIEIGCLTFASFPRARRRLLCACGGILLIAMATRIAVHQDPAVNSEWYRLWYSVLIPLTRAGTLWICVAMLGIAAWHRVPLHAFHQALLIGFILYISIVTVSFALVSELGPGVQGYSAAVEQLAYAATVGLWTWAAWRRAPALSPIRRELQPWALSAR